MDYFKYNNKTYQSYNLKKTLKKMGITINDIELFTPEIKNEPVEKSDITLHHFRLPNGYTVTSIYDNLNHLNITDYGRID